MKFDNNLQVFTIRKKGVRLFAPVAPSANTKIVSNQIYLCPLKLAVNYELYLRYGKHTLAY